MTDAVKNSSLLGDEYFRKEAEEMGWVEEEGELQCGLVEPGPV